MWHLLFKLDFLDPVECTPQIIDYWASSLEAGSLVITHSYQCVFELKFIAISSHQIIMGLEGSQGLLQELLSSLVS
jgi:hypothetical protein